MSEQQRACAIGDFMQSALDELNNMSVRLACLIEGIGPLHERVIECAEGIDGKRARSALPVIIDRAIEDAWAVVAEIDGIQEEAKKQ